jgi:hypothetical protein
MGSSAAVQPRCPNKSRCAAVESRVLARFFRHQRLPRPAVPRSRASIYVAGDRRLLRENHLGFLGFDLPSGALQKFRQRFTNQTAMTYLALWHSFEMENPSHPHVPILDTKVVMIRPVMSLCAPLDLS